MRASGPGGNAPAPKALYPGPGPYEFEVVDRWEANHRELIEIARLAVGKNISRTGMRNPFFHWIRMNLADAFEIIEQHGERHLGQVEERKRRLETDSYYGGGGGS